MDHLKLDLRFAVSAAALLVVTPLAAMVPATGDPRRDRERPQAICWGRNDDAREVVSRKDESYTFGWEAVGCEVQVRIRGEIGFNSDFTAIARIAPGGSVRLIEEAGSTERRLDIEPGEEGLEYTWRVDDREAPFDAAASDWLSEMLLQLFRSAGYAANERSLWFLRERGMPGLLQEIDEIDQLPRANAHLGLLSDHNLRGIERADAQRLSDLGLGDQILCVRDHTRGVIERVNAQLRSGFGLGDHNLRVYYQVALEHGDLDTTGAAQLIEHAAARIRSDHELSRLLLATGERFDFNDPMRDAFLEASRTLESDHERERVLAAVLERGTLDAATAAALLTSAAELNSDHKKAQLLTGLAARYTLEPAIRDDYLRAAATICSDHDKRRVLDTLIAQGSLDTALAALLDVVSTIHSDHEVSSILVALASADIAEPTLQSAFLAAAATIESDPDHRLALTGLPNAGRLAPDVAVVLGQLRVLVNRALRRRR